MPSLPDHLFRASRARVARRIVVGLVLASLVLLAGCSATRIAYNYAGLFVMGYVDDYLDITAEQEARLRAVFADIQDAHREQALPYYVGLLRATRGAIETGMDPSEVECFVRSVEVLYADLIQRLVPLAAVALSDLSEEQRQTLAQTMAREGEDYTETYLEGSRDERIERRAESLAKRLKFWIGPLTDEQRNILEQVLDQLPDRFEEWREYRSIKQEELLALIDAGASRAQLETFLNAWWVDHRGWPHTDEARESVTRILVAVHERLEPKQQRHAINRLGGLADDLEGLIPVGVSSVDDVQVCAFTAMVADGSLASGGL